MGMVSSPTVLIMVTTSRTVCLKYTQRKHLQILSILEVLTYSVYACIYIIFSQKQIHMTEQTLYQQLHAELTGRH